MGMKSRSPSYEEGWGPDVISGGKPRCSYLSMNNWTMYT